MYINVYLKYIFLPFLPNMTAKCKGVFPIEKK